MNKIPTTRQAQAIDLYRVKKVYPQSECARIMGISLSAFKKLYKRAKNTTKF